MRQIPFGKPIIGEPEKNAVLDVLSGPILVHGPRSKKFEEDFSVFTKGGNAVSVSSCTAGMHLAYFDLGIGPGDEVIVPSQTHTATAHAVEFCGATPVFVDAEDRTGNIDIDLIETAVTENTKAIAVVHFLGIPVEMDRVNQIAEKKNLFVLEDCALSIGAYYDGVHTGLHGDAGCFSFYPVKHMTTAEGGMFLTKHDELAGRIERKKAFGVDRHMGERKIPGIYDVNMLGYNYRLNEIQAALGIEQIKRLDDFLNKRKSNFNLLHDCLKDLEEIKIVHSENDRVQSSYYCMSVILNHQLREHRYEIVDFLKDNGVGTSVYYPKPVPHMKYYQEKYSFTEDSFPNAANISYGSIALPVGPHLGADDMEYIFEILKQAISKFS